MPSYGPCQKCGYKTDCKRRYINHMLRVTDCTIVRDDEWIRNDCRDAVGEFNRSIDAFRSDFPETEPLPVGRYKKEFARILKLASQLRWRLPLLESKDFSGAKLQADLDDEVAALKLEYRARLDMDAAGSYHCAARGVDEGKSATGCTAGGAVDEVADN